MHEFSCSCIDNSIKGNMCKHIHAVAMHSCDSLSLSLKRKQEDEILNEINQNILVTPTENSATQSKQQFKAVENKLSICLNLTENISVVENLTPESIIEVDKHMDKVLSILQSANEIDQLSKPQNSEPANKNMPMQRLHSTKKKRKISKTTLNKPTVAYKETILECVNDDEIINISDGNEHTYSKKL